MGTTHFKHNVNIKENLDVDGIANIKTLVTDEDVNIKGDLDVDTNLNVDGTADITGAFVAKANANIKGNLDVDGNLNLDGNLTRGVKTLDIDYGTSELTDAVELEVTTGLTTVEVVVACESVEAGTTPATKILALKSATAGKIKLQAVDAVGTTTVNWIAIGAK